MKSDFLSAMKAIDNFTYTENGAVNYKSTGNKVLDAFGSLGAMKNSDEDEILNTFYDAFFEDKALAMKLLFYVRDVRGGQGMRRVFRTIARSLAFKHPELVQNNMDNFLFFGRGDDYLCLVGTPCEEAMLQFVYDTITEDLKSVDNGGGCTMLAKWLPSENASSKATKELAKVFINKLYPYTNLATYNASARQYRKLLAKLRGAIGIVESKMSANKWNEIDFSKLPSRAALIYRDAFVRHSMETYMQYLKDVAEGKAKVNAGALFPVDIIKNVYSMGYNGNSISDELLYDAMWKALPNYFGDTEETGICMCDTSGSMSGEPILVSLSLGLYCADKCKGPFKNHFITFDYQPVLQEVRGETIVDKVRGIRSINPANTNFEAALQLILDTAVVNKLPQSDIPSKLYVISDMQFDEATGKNSGWSWSRNTTKYEPFMQKMKKKFAEHGYVMPAIVYWNVRQSSNGGMFHETYEGEDCCMVSGYSPSLFKSVIEGTDYVEEVNSETGEVEVKQKIDPVTVMLRTLNNERYDRVFVG